jgi:hypothetical protein
MGTVRQACASHTFFDLWGFDALGNEKVAKRSDSARAENSTPFRYLLGALSIAISEQYQRRPFFKKREIDTLMKIVCFGQMRDMV